MTASVYMHPASVSRGVENARQIVRSAKGFFDDAIILDACDYLEDYGNWMDMTEAREVRKAIISSACDEINEDGRWRGTVASVVAAGALLVLTWMILVVAMVAV